MIVIGQKGATRPRNTQAGRKNVVPHVSTIDVLMEPANRTTVAPRLKTDFDLDERRQRMVHGGGI